MVKSKTLHWILQNVFVLMGLVFSLLNLWSLSKLNPLISDIRDNKKDIIVNAMDISENKSTLIQLMENISTIKSDVSFIRGRIE